MNCNFILNRMDGWMDGGMMDVCACVHIYIYTYVCVCGWEWLCVFIHAYLYHMCIYICVYIHIYMCVCAYLCMCVSVYVYALYIYTYWVYPNSCNSHHDLDHAHEGEYQKAQARPIFLHDGKHQKARFFAQRKALKRKLVQNIKKSYFWPLLGQLQYTYTVCVHVYAFFFHMHTVYICLGPKWAVFWMVKPPSDGLQTFWFVCWEPVCGYMMGHAHVHLSNLHHQCVCHF